MLQEKRGGTPQFYVPAQYRFFEKINQNVNDTYRIDRERHLSAQVTYITPTDLVLHIIVYCFIVNILFMVNFGTDNQHYWHKGSLQRHQLEMHYILWIKRLRY